MLVPIFAVVLFGLAATMLGAAGLGRYFRRKHAKEQLWLRLPSGSLALRQPGDNWAPVVGHAQLALAFVGTYGARRGPHILDALIRAGGAQHVAVVYAVEMDEDERATAVANTPPAMADRLVVCNSNRFPVGLESKSYEEVEQLSRYWKPDVEAGAQLASPPDGPPLHVRPQIKWRAATGFNLLTPGQSTGDPALLVCRGPVQMDAGRLSGQKRLTDVNNGHHQQFTAYPVPDMRTRIVWPEPCQAPAGLL